MNRRERRAASKKSDKNSGENSETARKASMPGAPATLCEAGLDHFRAGRHLDAQLCCQQALELNPDHGDSLHLMGLLSLHARQYDHALEWISRAIRQDPRPDYIASLGATLHQQGRHEEALKAYDKAIQLRPDDAGLWHHLGNILLKLERLDHALSGFQHVLKLDPRHQDAAYKSGVLLHHMGRFEESIAHFDLCNEVLPDRAATLQARARTLFSLKRFEEALAENRRANTLEPGNADTCNKPDYRWLLDRDDSPWYPSVRLFRQTETREYETVLDRARTELANLISVRKPAIRSVRAGIEQRFI
jgi:tetratricopeptide (TPR) repeat protein